jgi:hypothetical protein
MGGIAGQDDPVGAGVQQAADGIRQVLFQLFDTFIIQDGPYPAGQSAVVVDDDPGAFPVPFRREGFQDAFKVFEGGIGTHAADDTDGIIVFCYGLAHGETCGAG